MTRQEVQKIGLPDVPGVYLFRKGREILYVGKATSLRDRVKSYFNTDVVGARGPRIVNMVALATTVEHKQTDSVLEALILEAELIKRYQPKYNVDAKDDKSWNYVIITKEDFPRVLMVRGKDLPFLDTPIQFEAGPFPHSNELKEALKIIRKIFPYRDTCELHSGTPCFNVQIGLCPGVCSGRVGKREYARTITHLKLFFRGKKGELMRTLEKEMKAFAKAQKFEEAVQLRNQIFALTHIRDVAMIKASPSIRRGELGAIREARIEAYDISHISGTSGVGVMVVMQGGRLAKGEYRKFKLRIKKNDDVGALTEVLTRRLRHSEWTLPELIVVDGGITQKNAAERVLAQAALTISVVAVTKDAHHKAHSIMGESAIVKDHHEDILAINAEVHRFAIAYHRHLRGKIR